MDLWLLPEAIADVEGALAWYGRQEPGLDEIFEAVLEDKLIQIRERPRAFPVVLGRVRRALLARFPYGVFYFEDGQRIAVVACLHTARDPRAWKRGGAGR
ncbi:MAG: type II toxin-antitoxin system RelE/ParE family toxin [Planctomycetes bacterium]|nr:type II toxin-antitoxin system RelE/ParE family toxin [Planctomycetota bacterium]